MTLSEQKRFAEKFMARRTSRIVGLQNGYAKFVEEFAADPFKHDTQEQANADTDGAPTDTSRVDPADQSKRGCSTTYATLFHGVDGSVPREGGDSDPAWKGDLRNAITSIQRAVENGGRGLDVNTVAGLNLLASTAQKLVELPEGVAVPKSTPNPEGVTRSPLVVADNDSSSHAGSHKFIPTSELSRMESEAAQLTKITSKIVGVTAL
jgi:hypothetical protein